MQLALLQLGLSGLDSLGSALSGNSVIDLFQNHRAGGQGAGPVGVDGLAFHDSLDGILIVRSPVDTGGDDVGVGAGVLGGAVVGNIGDLGVLASGGSAEGVSVLADELAAIGDQLLSAFLLQSLIVPAAGEGNFHGGSGADRASAQEERGVAGDNFRIGESTDIADLSLILGKLAGIDHLVELHTGGNTGQVTALIDGGEGIVIVGQLIGVSAGAGGVAELDIGILLGGVDHEGLMAEAVGEDDVAAILSQVASGVVALLALGNVGLEDVVSIGQTQILDGRFSGVDEVEVVGGVFVVQGDEADLDLGLVRVVFLLAAGEQAQSHDQGEEQCQELFHSIFLLLNM